MCITHSSTRHLAWDDFPEGGFKMKRTYLPLVLHYFIKYLLGVSRQNLGYTVPLTEKIWSRFQVERKLAKGIKH